MEDLPRSVIVLPAGGTGDRLEHNTPKQYVTVAGKPVYIHTVLLFHLMDWIQEIYLVINDLYMDKVKDELRHHNCDVKVRLISGSNTRHRSIQNGVLAARDRKLITKAEVVLIHDVVRPIVSHELCETVARNGLQYGACGPVRKLVSTVLTVDEDGFMKEALPRPRLRASEMPQGFRLDMITRAYENINDEELDHGTECLLLAQKYNSATCRVRLLEWKEDLFKVTFPRDLLALEAMLKPRSDTNHFMT